MTDVSGPAGQVLWGLLSNLVFEAGSKVITLHSARRSAATARARSLQEKLEAHEPVRRKLDQAVANLARLLPDGKTNRQLKRFLVSPQLQSFTNRLLLATFTFSSDEETDWSTFEAELANLVAESSRDVSGLGKQIAADLLLELVSICTEVFNWLIANESFAAHEIASQERFRYLKKRIDSITKRPDSHDKTPTIDQLVQFEERYLSQLEVRFGDITPPSLDRRVRVPISKLYVIPEFHRLHSDGSEFLVEEFLGEEEEMSPNRVGYSDFADDIYRTVVLGMPGGGKSSLVAHLAWSYSGGDNATVFAGPRVIPLVASVRELALAKDADPNLSIRDYLDTVVLQLELKPLDGVIDYWLASGKALVIFDGLDEVLDSHHREKASKAIELFCKHYEAASVLVTSREVGYFQAPLGDHFTVYRLASFAPAQTRHYAENWFRHSETSEESALGLTEQFIREAATVPDLLSVPLLLGLICTLYRASGFIPKNRNEVYEKCALLLFERWDSHRGIGPAFTFEDQFLPVVSEVAHWIYQDASLQDGVAESDLVRQTARYFERYDDPDIAHRKARVFIEFCTGRAWVFSDAGLDDEGNSLFTFAHRTFLEYFTATYLLRKFGSPTALVAAIAPRVFDSEWEVVTQLAVQMMNRRLEGAGQEIVDSLMRQVPDSAPQKRAVGLFLAEALAFLRVPADQLREVVRFCLGLCLAPLENRAFASLSPYPPQALSLLWNCHIDLLPYVEAEVEAFLLECWNGSTEERLFAIETLIFDPTGSVRPEFARACYQRVTESIERDHLAPFRALASQHWWVAWWATLRGWLKVAEALKLHQSKALLRRFSSNHYGKSFGPLADNYLFSYSQGDKSGRAPAKVRAAEECWKELAQLAPDFAIPWSSEGELISFRGPTDAHLTVQHLDNPKLDEVLLEDVIVQCGHLDLRESAVEKGSPALFLAIVFGAVMYEWIVEADRAHLPTDQYILLLFTSVAPLAAAVVLRRHLVDRPTRPNVHFDGLGFSSSQVKLLQRWADCDFDFIAKRY